MRRALAAALVGALALLGASGVEAQQVDVRMSVDRERVQIGELVRLTIRAEITGASGAQVQVPPLGDFDVVQQQVSRPFTLRLGTGQGTQHVQSTEMHSLVLRARSEGTFEIPPATVSVNGRRFESGSVTLVVGSGGPAPTPDPGDGASQAQPPGPQPGLPPGEPVDGMAFDAEAFVRTWVDRAEPYVGQQATVSLYLYSREPLRGSPAITQEPSTDGFWVQDLMPRNQRLTAEHQRLSGVHYNVYLLRRFAAFPLRSGELTIGPATIEVRQNSIFDILGRGGGPAGWSRTGVPVTLRVRPLPEDGRPDGEVHVGALTLTGELDRTEVPTGDAVTLTITARGQGPLDQLRIPGPEGDGLRVLAPEIRDQMSTSNGVVGGTRIARWLIVPERPGRYALGPFEIATFDPVAGRYGVARVPAMTLEAAGNAPGDVADDAAEGPDEEPAADGEGEAPRFRPVHTRSALSRTHASWVEAPWFLWLYALGPLAFLGAIVVRRARRRAASSDPKAAPKRAKKAARRRLAAAEGHARDDQPREFYAAVAAALKEVLEARLGQAVGSLTFPELRQMLEERGMDEALAGRLVDELEGCDFARFSAVGVSGEEMERCLERSRGLLGELDRFTPTAEEDEG